MEMVTLISLLEAKMVQQRYLMKTVLLEMVFQIARLLII